MHVDRIPNRTSPPAFLLRETYREGGKVKKRTLANITQWPVAKIEELRRLLRDEYAPHEPRPDLKLMRSLPHGHVAAALGMLRKLGLDDLLAEGQRQGARMVALVTALVVARLLDPASKLTTARLLDGTTATSSLGTVLALGKVDEQELYDALDWLLAQQERIETALARRHLSDGTLVLYDVSSTYFEGRTCELAKFGHNRDGKSGDSAFSSNALGDLSGAAAKFEAVFNQSGILAGILDLQGYVREVNRLAMERCGYTKEQVLDRLFWDTPWWRGSEEMKARIRFATGQAAAGAVFREELRYWVADGSERIVDFAMNPVRDESGVVVFLHPTGIDITERKEIEAALRERETRLRWLASIVESSDDAIVTKNLDGIIASWNGGAERVFGYTAEEAIGQPITIVIPQDRLDEERTILTRIRRGERIDHFETVRQRKHGSLIVVSLTVSPVKNAEGKIVGARRTRGI